MKKKSTVKKINNWRHLTAEEKNKFRVALQITNLKLGRPFVHPDYKKKPISIKLDPRVLKYFKSESKKRGIGYQTLINEVLKKAAKIAA